MKSTTNYQLVKQELTDKPDITQIAGNWDTIDTQLKNLSDGKFDKTGGTISGAVTITGKLTANGSIDASSLSVTGGATFASPIKITNSDTIQSQVPVTRGTNPNSMQYSHWSVYDQGGHSTSTNRLGRVQYSINTDGTATMAMYVNKFSTVGSEEVAGITAQWGTDGKAKVSILHDPEQSANDRQLATTKWVKGLTATTSQHGLVRLASESDILNETDKTVIDVPSTYKLHDFRRMNTAYAVGDKVNCAFNFGVYLECKQAGTTSSESLDTHNVKPWQVFTDGTVQWEVIPHVKSVNGNTPNANGNVVVRSFATTEILPNTDLNTILKYGDYYCPANVTAVTLLNCPTNEAFLLSVKRGTDYLQELRHYNGNGRWVRNYNTWSNTWTDWQLDTTSQVKQLVLNTFFPVGSIYMDATGNINPNTQFGGTWVQIQNAFLYASGNKSVGNTGGEETHKLTTNEIPAHTHGVGTLTGSGTFTVGGDKNDSPSYSDNSTGVFSTYANGDPFHVYGRGDASNALSKKDIDFWLHRNSGGNTDWYGGQDAHNNMPPYLVVNVWKRTA